MPHAFRWRRWAVVAGSVVLMGAGVAAFCAPAYLKRKVVAAAAARGVLLDVERVKLGWHTVSVEGATGALEGVTGVGFSAREVSARWTFSGLEPEISVTGIDISLDGGSADIASSIAAWRERHRPAADTPRGVGHTFSLHDAHVTWTRAGEELAHGAFANASVDARTLSVTGASAHVALGGLVVDTTGLSATLDRETKRVEAFHAGTLVLQLGEGEALGGASKSAPASEQVPTGETATLGARLWGLLERGQGLVEKLADHLGAEAQLNVDALTVVSPRGMLGPWGAGLTMSADAVVFELIPTEKEGRKPLAVRAVVPRGAGKWTGEVAIGPATLAEVGVQEGAFGLTDVAHTTAEVRGTLELDPVARTVVADGSVQLHGGSLTHPRLADGSVSGIELGLRGVVASRDGLASWSIAGGRFDLGSISLRLDGTFEAASGADGKPYLKTNATWAVPTISCGDLLASLPKGLVPKLEGLRMEGSFAAQGSLAIDTRTMDKAEVELAIDQRCRIAEAPASIALARFKRPFELQVYDPQGNPGKMQTFGPGAGGWTPLGAISPYVLDAVLTCEDGAFFSHHGFSPQAIRNALLADLKAQKFVLGASTVSMQLAKNLFLDRRKQLARKVQEAVLTVWLEQELSKEQMMELYLNVIEFGPNLYGIGPAAMHYFGRPAEDLDPLESLFLIDLLRAPVARGAIWSAATPDERRLQELRYLLKEMHRRGKIDDDEYEEAAARTLVFHHPSEPLPEPHPLTGVKAPTEVTDPGFDDPTATTNYDSAWAPVE